MNLNDCQRVEIAITAIFMSTIAGIYAYSCYKIKERQARTQSMIELAAIFSAAESMKAKQEETKSE